MIVIILFVFLYLYIHYLGHHDDKNKKLGNETSRRKILTRNATEANIIDSHREKKLDPKDRMTPFKRKTINTEEINKTQGNLTTRLGIYF